MEGGDGGGKEMGDAGGSSVGKWRQLYLNINKKESAHILNKTYLLKNTVIIYKQHDILLQKYSLLVAPLYYKNILNFNCRQGSTGTNILQH